MADISEIKPHELIPIRQAVLRQGLPVEASIFDGDYAEHTVHFGAFENNQLIGCASLVANQTTRLEGQINFMMQLRGMAVLPEYRSKGVGAQLLRAAEKHAVCPLRPEGQRHEAKVDGGCQACLPRKVRNPAEGAGNTESGRPVPDNHSDSAAGQAFDHGL